MIRELKTFVAVNQYGSFAAAGQHVGLTQSAVSAQIRALENMLGMTLFDRSSRRAKLNVAGTRVLPLAQEILELFSRMAQPEDIHDFRGVARIGAIATVQSGLMPEILTLLQRQAPRVAPLLAPGVSFNLIAMVDAGDLDLAVIIKPDFSLPKELWCETLHHEPYVLITPSDVHGDDVTNLLCRHRLVRYNRASFGGKLVTRFLRQHQLDPELALELDDIDAIVRMVEKGFGVALIPQCGLWQATNPHVRIVTLGEMTFYRELVIVMRHTNRQTPLNRLLVRCMHQAVGQQTLSSAVGAG